MADETPENEAAKEAAADAEQALETVEAEAAAELPTSAEAEAEAEAAAPAPRLPSPRRSRPTTARG